MVLEGVQLPESVGLGSRRGGEGWGTSPTSLQVGTGRSTYTVLVTNFATTRQRQTIVANCLNIVTRHEEMLSLICNKYIKRGIHIVYSFNLPFAHSSTHTTYPRHQPALKEQSYLLKRSYKKNFNPSVFHLLL